MYVLVVNWRFSVTPQREISEKHKDGLTVINYGMSSCFEWVDFSALTLYGRCWQCRHQWGERARPLPGCEKTKQKQNWNTCFPLPPPRSGLASPSYLALPKSILHVVTPLPDNRTDPGILERGTQPKKGDTASIFISWAKIYNEKFIIYWYFLYFILLTISLSIYLIACPLYCNITIYILCNILHFLVILFYSSSIFFIISIY